MTSYSVFVNYRVLVGGHSSRLSWRSPQKREALKATAALKNTKLSEAQSLINQHTIYNLLY